jgi:hypothetical protein
VKPQFLPVSALPASCHVPAWQVLRASAVDSRFEALRSTKTPLIGRDKEIELLMRSWQQAKQGDGQVVLIFGEQVVVGLIERAGALLDELVVDIDHQAPNYSEQYKARLARTQVALRSTKLAVIAASAELADLEAANLLGRSKAIAAAMVANQEALENTLPAAGPAQVVAKQLERYKATA